MDMRFDALQLPQQVPVISYRQIAAVRLLQLSSMDLEATISREQVENPALEAETRACCPRCATPLDMPGVPCPGCGLRLGGASEAEWSAHPLGEGAASHNWDDDASDPLLRVAAPTVRGDTLLQLLRLSLPEREAPIAEHLVGSLDSHGFLPEDILEQTAQALRVSVVRVARALVALHELEPAGIGARGARECLLIQLRRLHEQGNPHPLAEVLVRDHLKELAFRRFREVGHALNLMPKQIAAEWTFIRTTLYPYPAHGFDAGCSDLIETAATVRPDVVIRRMEGGYHAEVVERQRYQLRVSDEYVWARTHLADLGASEADRLHIRNSLERAHSFIGALTQRWETMQRVADALIELQRAYLDQGPSGLQPLTRADVAHRLELHESTVSRATDGKYVLLPDGRTVAFDDFFDNSLPIRQALTEIIGAENPRHPYSDEQLVGLLAARGLLIARRTVAKYREEMDILPSRLRRQRPQPRTSRRRRTPVAVATAR